jgi:hypothetical protein
MLSKFKLQTLKQKLWAIVAASFVARVIIFFTLPNLAVYVVPDEAVYAELVQWLGESKPTSQFPGYGKGLYLSGRTTFVPASLLYRIGLNELDAMRLVSTIYGFCALLLLVFFSTKLYDQYKSKVSFQAGNESLILVTISIFAFLPSHFLWSNLGIRESATEFWLIATFVAFYFIFHYQSEITVLSVLVLVGAIVFVFSARPQVGWVLGVSLIIFLIFNLRKTKSYFLLAIVLCGVIAGSTLILGSSKANNFSPLINSGETIQFQQSANQVGADSVIQPPFCPIGTPSTKIDTYFCIAWKAPYMVPTFLFRPVIGVDVTSISSLIAAVENIFWLLVFVMIVFLYFKRRPIQFIVPILPALIFFVLYVLGASAYQGNMGTGFRHKSLILWAVLLVIFALAWRRPAEPVENARNNSQENAV